MAKLIVKHELPPPTPLEKLAEIAQIVLPVVLVVVVIAVAVSLYLSSFSGSSSNKTVAAIPSSPAVTTQLPDSYLSEANRLDAMALEFDDLLSKSKEDYNKHQQLVDKAEAILAQVSKMDALVADMSLPDTDKKILQNRHQYQKDYWESKLVFHRLRMARFKMNDTPVTVETGEIQESAKAVNVQGAQAAGTSADLAQPEDVEPVTTESVEEPVRADTVSTESVDVTGKTAAAGPPAGVKLPDGFCPLFGPGAAECKANAKKP